MFIGLPTTESCIFILFTGNFYTLQQYRIVQGLVGNTAIISKTYIEILLERVIGHVFGLMLKINETKNNFCCE